MLIRPGREEAAPAGAQAIVRPGDTLWSLAAEQLGPHATDARIADHWPRWYELNRTVIGDRPDLIFPGQVLEVPEISPP
nr:LysM peptidoglycan-binding domain-containing protein [Arthrobacter jiangjiafuii]